MRICSVVLWLVGSSCVSLHKNFEPSSTIAAKVLSPSSGIPQDQLYSSDSTLTSLSTKKPTDPSTCRDVHQVPEGERCSHVREHCYTDEYNVGVLNYLGLYYCQLPRSATGFIAIIAVVLNFAGLGKTAADFLSPNLYTISKALQLSDHLAGLTLLAMGNSAADIFGTYTAFSVGSTELAISELIGATLFVLSVVVGSICIVHPFSVPKLHYIRDGVSYLAILLIFEIFMEKGSLSFIGSSILLAIYIVYVMAAVLFHSWSRLSSRKKLTAARIRSNFEESSPTGSYDIAIDGSTHLLPGIDTLEDLTDEERKMLDELKSYFASHPGDEIEVPVPVQTGTYGLRVLLRELSHHSSGNTSYKAHEPFSSPGLPTFTNALEAPRIEVTRSPDIAIRGNLMRSESSLSSGLETFPKSNAFKEALLFLLPKWHSDDSWPYKMVFVLTFPAHILLSFTTPVRERALNHASSVVRRSNAFNLTVPSQESLHSIEEEYDVRLDLFAFKIQFVFAIATLAASTLGIRKITFLLLPLIVLLSSSVAFVLLPSRCPQFQNQLFAFRAWNYAGAALGFILAIHWISVFAAEVIAILKQFALILGVSDEILGVTVFAMGNSIGDLVSNLTIASMGLPLMAFAACFGGPLLSLCSMGLSSIVVMAKADTSHLTIITSKTLRLNVIVIIFILIFMNVYFSITNYQADRRLGLSLIAIWMVTVSISAYFELQ